MTQFQLAQLAFDIEVNRQRIFHAKRTNNVELLNASLRLLAVQHSQYFDATKNGVTIMEPVVRQLLVFCERYPDGKRLTIPEYRDLLKTMDRCDRLTHTAVEIAPGMEEAVEQVVLLEASSKKSA